MDGDIIGRASRAGLQVELGECHGDECARPTADNVPKAIGIGRVLDGVAGALEGA